MSKSHNSVRPSSRGLLEAIERATHAGIAAVDADGTQIYVNPAFCRLVDFEEEELLGKAAPFAYWPPEEFDAIQSAFDRTVAGDAPSEGFELRFMRKDGTRIDVQLALAPLLVDGTAQGWLASMHDITTRKRAEAQLAEAQRLAGIGSWHWDVATNEVGWSPELYRQYGRDPEIFAPSYETFLDQIVEEDRPRVQEALRRALEEDADYALDMRIRRPSGEIVEQRVLGRLERDDEGRPLRMFGTSQDITVQKRDEKERLDETIQRIALSFSQELDEHRLVQRITDEATLLAGAEFGALFFNSTTEEGDAFMLYTLSGAPREAFENFPLPRATPIFAPTFNGEPVRCDDVRTDPRYGAWGPQPEGHLPVVSYLAVPVTSRTGEVLGGLFFGHGEPGQFTERHERLMTALAGHAAVALDNARLYRKLRSSEEVSRAARIDAERTAAILADQRTVLEMIAAGAPLEETLEKIVGIIEKYAAGSLRSSILLLDGDQLRVGAGPSLPDDYNAAIDGVKIGPNVGSCGTSAFFNREVLVVDIATDPLWADYKDIALGHGLRACWSTPIRSADGAVLGTFAVYHEEASEPSEEERQLVDTLNRTAAIAVERKQVEEALHEANVRKDEFLALLGHELRNPLAPILTALELMELRGVGAAKERGAIDRQVRHMMQLVDDLLDISRITRGKLELDRKPLQLDFILADAAEMAGPLIEERSHHLSIGLPAEPLLVEGDAIRLAQVFSNLLTNAAKYTEPEGHIEVRAERDEDHILITVTDDGLGIDANLLPRVFEPFIQGKRGIDRLQGGLGLGLPLVRNLVVLHEGEVTAFSAGEGLGTQITVRLPLSRTPAQDITPPLPGRLPHAAVNARRILLVDDNKDAAVLMADLLEAAGYEVTVAHDGPEALSLSVETEFHAAVVDIGLPVMSGHELGKKLLEQQDLRLVAVTGYGQESDRQQSAEAGFAVHLVKPVHYEALIDALEGLADVSADAPEKPN